jgi:hypothetical protein
VPPSSGLKHNLSQKPVEAGVNTKVCTVQVGFSPVSICLLIQHKLSDFRFILHKCNNKNMGCRIGISS